MFQIPQIISAPIPIQQQQQQQLPPAPLSPIIIPQQQSLPSQQQSSPIIPLTQNDINDAQEISKILQQCHNGVENKYNVTENNIEYDNDSNHKTIKDESDDENEPTVEVPKSPQPKIKFESDENSNNSIDDELKENVKLKNLQVRTIVFKDIRRPGRDYSSLLDHLNEVKGNFETRFNFIQMCINESLRFRRKKMADSIQDWWEKQIDTLNIS